MELDELVQTIFSSDPKPPKSCVLELDTNAKEIERSDMIFGFLLEFVLEGIKYKYGPINTLSDSNISQLQSYVNSIGFKLCLIKDSDPVTIHQSYQFKENTLESKALVLKFPEEKILLYFEFL